MDYWHETMQDDVYLIAADGWQESARPRGVIEDKERKIKESPDLTVKRKKYKMDLVPPRLIVARYFAKDQARIEELQAAQESAARELEEFLEEHSGEEDLLSEVKNDKGNVTKTEIPKRLKALKGQPEAEDEIAALKTCQKLLDAEANAKKAVKDAQVDLDARVLAHYGSLSEDEIKTLVVDDKWLASIREVIEGEVQRLTNTLAGRVKELDERYAQPLPSIEDEVERLSQKVAGHLERMGVRVDV
jgi:type I restriction enzyme M protein